MLAILQLEDHTGKQYVSVFDEGGKALLGKSAQEMHQFMENGEASYETTLQAALFKQGIFTLKVCVFFLFSLYTSIYIYVYGEREREYGISFS